MSDDICSHPTQGGDGPPCQNPAGGNGRCHIPAHNPGSDGGGFGRPTEYTEEKAHIAINAARSGKSRAGVEREVGVGRDTIFGDGGWIDQDHTFVDEDGNTRHFSVALRRARGDGEDTWIGQGRHPDADSSFAKFMLATSYDYVKTERREVDADVEHSGSVAWRQYIEGDDA